MVDLDIQAVIVQQGSRRIAELNTESALILLKVAHPELFAAEVESLQNPGASHGPDVLTVGDRRG